MKKLTLNLIFLSQTLFAVDTLIDALLDGNLTHKINAHYNEGTEEDVPLSSTKTQKILFHYQTAPISGLKLEVATQSFATETRQNSSDNTLYYTEALYDGATEIVGYKLRANYYADTYRQSVSQNELSTTNAIGLKAEMNYENFGSYVAYSKVLDGNHNANSSTLEGKDQLLPTTSVLSSNNYTPNTEAYAIDLNYAPRKDLLLGSRYVIANEFQHTLSYTGVYSSFRIDEIAKGLNFGISYDKTGIDKQNDQFSINLKSTF